jgi:uncharacterized membrane protein
MSEVELIAIAYPDPFSASLAMQELQAPGADVVVRHDEMSVVVRDEDGVFHVATHAVITTDAPSWSMFWSPLFACLFFVPLAGMPIGSDLAPLVDAIERAGIDRQFRDRVRALMTQGTSTLFVILQTGYADAVVGALEEYGGTVLESTISPDAEETLTSTLGGWQDAS